MSEQATKLLICSLLYVQRTTKTILLSLKFNVQILYNMNLGKEFCVSSPSHSLH